MLLLLALAPVSVVCTLYVSSSQGSDANAGTSPAAAVQTLERASAMANGALHDTSLLLLSGDTFPLSTAWFLTGLRNVTISSYGTLQARPRLTRAAPAAGPTITIDNSSSIALQGLEVEGGENGVAFTFDNLAARTVFSNFSITDCFFNAVQGLHYNASSGSWWGAAIAFAARHSGVLVEGVTIAHNLVNGSDVFYSNSVPYSGFTRAEVVHLTIDSNALTHNSYNTLFLDSTSFVNVMNNVFLGNTPSQLFVAGTTDIIMGTLNSSVRLRGNELSGRGEYQPGGPDGCALDFETNATGVEFSGNYISRSFGAGIMVFGHVPGSNRDLLLMDNIILNSGCGQCVHSARGRGGRKAGGKLTVQPPPTTPLHTLPPLQDQGRPRRHCLYAPRLLWHALWKPFSKPCGLPLPE